MKSAGQQIQDQYLETFRDFLADGGEAARERAYELGRETMAQGMGLLEVAATHREAVRVALEEAGAGEVCDRIVEQAAQFFAEILSPYELSYRGFRDAVEQLESLNTTLERRVAERTAELERARDEALAASRAKSEFLAVMSHELRTPLNAIIGYADLLLMGTPGPLTDLAREQVQRIIANAQHLVEIVEEVLTFARVDPSTERVMVEKFDLRDLISEVTALFRPLALEKGLGFRTRVPSRPVEVETDRAKLRQILLNLLSNAVKFTEEGHISLCAAEIDGWITLEVRDTGIGIAPEHRERIFDAFWQVESGTTRRAPGTGLGLSVARQIGRLLGGDVVIEEPPRRGSRFVARVPARAPTRAEPAAAAEES